MSRINKLRIIILSTALLVGICLFYSGNNARNKYKRIQKDLETTSDSLKTIHKKYLVLENEYNRIYTKLDSTRLKFNALQSDVNSILGKNMHSLMLINRDLKKIVENEKLIPKVDIVIDTFRFN